MCVMCISIYVYIQIIFHFRKLIRTFSFRAFGKLCAKVCPAQNGSSSITLFDDLLFCFVLFWLMHHLHSIGRTVPTVPSGYTIYSTAIRMSDVLQHSASPLVGVQMAMAVPLTLWWSVQR